MWKIYLFCLKYVVNRCPTRASFILIMAGCRSGFSPIMTVTGRTRIPPHNGSMRIRIQSPNGRMRIRFQPHNGRNRADPDSAPQR